MEPLVVHIDTSDLHERIVERTSHLLLERLQDTVEREARARILPAIDTALNTALNTLVESAVTRVFTPVDAFGEPTGQKTTIASLLAKKSENFLSEKVDCNGTTSTSPFMNKQQRVEYIVGKVVKDALDAQLQKEVRQIATEAKAQAKAAVTKLLVEQLSK